MSVTSIKSNSVKPHSDHNLSIISLKSNSIDSLSKRNGSNISIKSNAVNSFPRNIQDVNEVSSQSNEELLFKVFITSYYYNKTCYKHNNYTFLIWTDNMDSYHYLIEMKAILCFRTQPRVVSISIHNTRTVGSLHIKDIHIFRNHFLWKY